jgi:hypothetical protein
VGVALLPQFAPLASCLFYLRRLEGEEGEGGFLCSSVKSDRERELSFVLKGTFYV